MRYFYSVKSLFTPCFLVFSLLALAANGCGKSTGSISGKVTYQGKPLPGGYVNFLSQGTNPVTKGCQIGADGKYSVSGVPVGSAKITVQGVSSRNLALARGQGGETKPDQPTVIVPAKYGSTEQSDLTFEVKSGSQVHDIDLK